MGCERTESCRGIWHSVQTPLNALAGKVDARIRMGYRHERADLSHLPYFRSRNNGIGIDRPLAL